MEFTNTPPDWNVEGVEPTNDIKSTGFKMGYKPPAQYFNWFWTKVSKCIAELQVKLSSVKNEQVGVKNSVNGEIFNDYENNVASGNYSTASGKHTSATGESQFVVGQYNKDDTDALFIVGNGESVSNKSNAMSVSSNGVLNAVSISTPTIAVSNNIVINGRKITSQDITGRKYATTGTGVIFHDYENNVASGEYSLATGYFSEASGYSSYAGGEHCKSTGIASFSTGSHCQSGDYQVAVGRYNAVTTAPTSITDTTGSIFMVGIGTSDSAKANAFRVSATGQCYGVKSFAASGADYAEYFEWEDGNPNNEDRRGLFVTLEGEKIRLASNDDDYILGVISAYPCVVGDIQSEQWKNRYVTDAFGSAVVEEVEVDGKIEKRFVSNPSYNDKLDYVSREERKEWDAVGLIGKLVVVDDGTCKVNGYCKVASDGKATISTERTAYRVMSRIDENHVRILVR